MAGRVLESPSGDFSQLLGSFFREHAGFVRLHDLLQKLVELAQFRLELGVNSGELPLVILVAVPHHVIQFLAQALELDGFPNIEEAFLDELDL